METKILEIAERIKGLRQLEELTCDQMADATDISYEDYIKCENGQSDFNFTFLYKCAKALGVDMVELLTGEKPRLSFYSLIRAGEGLDIKRREGFTYEHMNYLFSGKDAETFLVTAPYKESEQNAPIHLSTHAGQEFDFIISGKLKVQLEDHTEILNPGDALYYDSGRGHGMIAYGGSECKFLSVVLRKSEEE